METSIRLPGPISLALLLAYGGLDPSSLPQKRGEDEDLDPLPTPNTTAFDTSR